MGIWERKQKKEIIAACKRLMDSGLIVRTWGNLSARGEEIDFKDRYLLITASGRNYQTMTMDEVVKVRMVDLSWKGRFEPSSETMMHRDLYRTRPDAKVILHTHQTFLSAVGCGSGMKGVPLAAYGVSGSQELANNVAAAAQKAEDVPAVIMKHHGMVCWGEDFDHAFQAAVDLEERAKEELEEQGIPTDGRAALHAWMKQKRESDQAPIMKPYLDDFAMLMGEEYQVTDPQNFEAAGEDDRKAMEILLAKNAICALASEVLGDGEPIMPQVAGDLRRKYLGSYSLKNT